MIHIVTFCAIININNINNINYFNKMKKISLFTIAFLLSSKAALAGYGYSPVTHEATICRNIVPGRPTITNVQSLGNGEIKIAWNTVDRATSWTVSYGNESNKYVYGIVNFGDNQSRAVNIAMLPAGTYYVALKANNGCMPGSFSPEQKIVISKNGSLTTTQTKRTIVQQIKKVIAPQATPTAVATQAPVEPTVTETIPSPTPTPEKVGFFKRIFNFIFN